MLKLMVLFVVQSQFVDCGCLCVDGVGRTLCQSVGEAVRQPNVCPRDLSCPTPPVTNDEAGAQEFYDAPVDNVHSCREVRVWDQEVQGYTAVKVCDVFTG